MRLITLSDLDRRAIAEHGSEGFDIATLGLLRPAHVAVVRLAAGGVIGRHDAMGAQVLIPVTGEAEVSGGDGVASTIIPGRAAIWEAGESHETRTTLGLTALVIEGVWEHGPATT